MKKLEPILVVKVAHTALWAIMAASILYILYSGMSGRITFLTYVALGMNAVEILVLLVFGGSCPLTIVAKRVKPDWKNGDDMFLPVWLAVHNKTIFGSLLIVGVVLVGYRLVTG